MAPLCFDLFAGLFGWGIAFAGEGYQVVGFDLEQRGPVPEGCELVLQDVLTLDGAQFRDAACIVASPPCQAYSYRAMPWKRAKALPPPDNSLFEACFRIQREASESAGHHIPMVVENVKGAQLWVGRAAWHFGSYYLWGDVPALMPFAGRTAKVPGLANGTFPGGGLAQGYLDRNGVKGFARRFEDTPMARFSSCSAARKAASAEIAKVPFPLAQHIARCFKPERVEAIS